MNRFDARLPLDCPTDEEALADYAELVKKPTQIKLAKWHSRSEGLELVHDIVIPMDKTGMLSSNRFHYGARMACDSANSPSVVRNWYIQKFRKGLEASVFYEKSPKTAMALRKYIPAQFRPMAARTIYDLFNAKKVYDPCMGWGDRLSGALAQNLEVYYGRDVNPFCFSGYSEQIKRLQSSTQVSCEMIGSEISCPEEEYFDLVFTSPPYFKMEKYAGDMQSHALYKTFEQWMEGYLYPTAKHCLDSVKNGGYVAINISDVYVNHKMNLICTPLIQYMRDIGATYLGAIGYEIGKRINHNNKNSQAQGFCEPVLVFGKGHCKPLEELSQKYFLL